MKAVLKKVWAVTVFDLAYWALWALLKIGG